MASRKKHNKIKKELSGEVMLNSRGKLVPIEMVRKDLIKQDKAVKKIFNLAFGTRQKMVCSKSAVLKEIESFSAYWAKFHKADDCNIKNLTLSSYANLLKVSIKSADIIQLDDTRQLAEAKIKNCLNRWGADANPYLKTVIEELFKTNKDGYVNVQELRALKQYEIPDTEWKEAMELLGKAERVVGKRTYINFQMRDNVEAKWKTVDLNFSSLEV